METHGVVSTTTADIVCFRLESEHGVDSRGFERGQDKIRSRRLRGIGVASSLMNAAVTCKPYRRSECAPVVSTMR